MRSRQNADTNLQKPVQIPERASRLISDIALQQRQESGQWALTELHSKSRCPGLQADETIQKNTAADVLRCFWWEQRESNPRPSACKADALNQLSYAPKLICIPTWSLFPNRECKYMTIFPFDKNNLTFLPPELRIYCATPQRTLISCAYFTFSRRNLRTSFHL